MELLRGKLSFIVALVAFLAHFSWADQTLDKNKCTSIDVSQRLGELRNQGNIGWCYANVAADLLTFRFNDELHGERASAGYVALTFNEFAKLKPHPDQDAGLISPAVFFSQRNGICPQSFQDTVLKNSPFKSIKEQIKGLVELKRSFDKTKSTHFKDLEIVKKYRDSNSYLNTLSDEVLVEILNSTSTRTFPRKLAETLCKPHMVEVKHDVKIRFQESFIEGWKHIFTALLAREKNLSPLKLGARDLIKEIHEELQNQNMVAISYYTRIFYEIGSAAYNKAGLHASSIVGRKWNETTRSCDFKLRNSWGKRCDSYTNPNLKNKCELDSGYVWVPDTLLQNSISDIVYYKSK